LSVTMHNNKKVSAKRESSKTPHHADCQCMSRE